MDSASGRKALDDIAERNPALASRLASRRDGFVRAAHDESEDDATRGRIVSAGWRSAKNGSFAELGARLPDTANGTMDVGPSRFESMHIEVSLEDAAAAKVELDGGRAVYPEVFPSTDRVIVAGVSSLEELLVLRNARAPRSFAWTLKAHAAASRVVEHEGALSFQDEHGRTVLEMATPRAYDAHGQPVSLEETWDPNAQRITLTVRSEASGDGNGLAYPVVIDPDFETSSWYDVARRAPGKRAGRNMTFDAARGQLVLFGGFAGAGLAGDTWIFDGSNWSARSPATVPNARAAHALAYDGVRREVVMFGGFTPMGPSSETWIWNGVDWSLRTPAHAPSARASHAMTFDVTRGEVVLFGGTFGGATSETWTWNGVDWTQKMPTGQLPPARANHSLAYDAARSQVVLFGGLDDSQTAFGDTWVWNGTAWAKKTLATSPAPRAYATLEYDVARGQTVLFGGHDPVAAAYADTWTWNGTAWTSRSPTTSPAARSDAPAGYDSARGELVVYGGATATDSLADTWAWNGTDWSRKILSPGSISESAMVFDSVRNEVILQAPTATWAWNGREWTRKNTAINPGTGVMAFDAQRGHTVLYNGNGPPDTYTFDGVTWTPKAPTTEPPPRHYQAMAYDAARREVLMFGGTGNDNALADTWTWNGTNWIAKAPGVSPAGRYGQSMAFDAARGEVVMFGGYTDFGRVNETWVWNGATWTKRVASMPPVGRYLSAMAYEPASQRVIMFGGFTELGRVPDTWAWNGTEWAQRFSSNYPPGRSQHAMAFDGARNQLVLYGGDGEAATLTDTWLHVTLGGACASNADCLDAFCVDGVCCNVGACGSCKTCAGTSPGRCTPVLNHEDADSCAASAGKSCDNLGTCRSALGATATNVADCASGFVADGVCCDSACDAPCQACRTDLKQSGEKSGVCGNAKAGIDPRNSCDETEPSTCGLDGSCDGRGGCRLHRANTACGPVTCLDQRSSSRICDGFGMCSASVEGINCGAYVCNEATGCKLNCASNDDCAPLQHCEDTVCVADRGAACEGNSVVAPNGERTPCGLYRCVGSRCLDACVNRLDCTDEGECTESHQCVRFERLAAPEEGGCVANGASETPTPASVAGMALVALVCARARRRAR